MASEFFLGYVFCMMLSLYKFVVPATVHPFITFRDARNESTIQQHTQKYRGEGQSGKNMACHTGSRVYRPS